MSKKDEALKLAREALDVATTPLARDRQEVLRAQAAIREVLAQPEQVTIQTEPNFDQRKQILDNLERCHHRDSKHEFLRVWIRDWTNHKLSKVQPERRPLTELEFRMLYVNTHDYKTLWEAIESKIKEKNA